MKIVFQLSVKGQREALQDGQMADRFRSIQVADEAELLRYATVTAQGRAILFLGAGLGGPSSVPEYGHDESGRLIEVGPGNDEIQLDSAYADPIQVFRAEVQRAKDAAQDRYVQSLKEDEVRQKVLEEAVVWIQEQGSEHLKRVWRNDLLDDCLSHYRFERVQKEHPTAHLQVAETDEGFEPTEALLDLLERCRKVDAGATPVWGESASGELGVWIRFIPGEYFPSRVYLSVEGDKSFSRRRS